ncbi:MAG: RNA polymerase factor sigma-54 [Bacillota bacterium]
MRIGQGLSLEQTQRLIITPELKQAITVLQLPVLELGAYLQQELLNNPLLELREDDGEEESGPDEPDLDWLDYFLDGSDIGYVRPHEEDARRDYGTAAAPTLHEHLLFQLNLQFSDRLDRSIGEFIIGNIDDNGYLRLEAQEAARALKVPQARADRVLAAVQKFDPPGVGARDVPECLRLQLAAAGNDDPLVWTLVARHLEDLAAGKLTKLTGLLGVRIQDIQAAADVIRALDPKPGARFPAQDQNRTIVPDAVIERVNGEYVVVLNDGIAPRLTISHVYRSLLRQPDTGGEVEQFLQSRLNAAVWLLRSVEQRRLTLYRVVESVVRFQRAFLDHGISRLRPLTLRHVAEEVRLHESTISRATSGKYVQTPQGAFELRFFFTSGVEDQAGAGVSAATIKRIIAELMAGEDPSAPLSDQALTDMLRERGLVISRRTVAKYRSVMKTPSSSRRKRY